ncbi:hypothetical protein WME89_19920 [Sorangium sp. So ce321]|uniref:hypothetical protein n=1 Tax=Sorangium sp. So ce321 TaxID=3133300 RepID=UPI003F6321FF
MKRTALPARRALLVALSALALGVPCCAGSDLSPSSEVEGLRVLAVTADKPYAAPPSARGPGEDVTFEMTYADGLGSPEGGARPVEITWLGGCVNPPVGVDEHIGCLPQLLGAVAQLAAGGADDGANEEGDDAPRLFDRDILITPEPSDEPGSEPPRARFTMDLPDSILDDAQPTETGTVYSAAYVFFTLCAGKVRVASAPAEAGFPLECVGEDGAVLGPDSFVVGYTQVYVFGDRRTNANPRIDGFTLKLEGNEVTPSEDGLSVVKRCARPEEQAQGCSATQPADGECTTYEIEALVPPDAAEEDVEAAGLGGPPVREAIWVDYYTDGGEFDGARRLVSDTVTGDRADNGTTWIPPSEPGRVSLWAVVHDTRGGASVEHREVLVK